jgi:DNA-binding MarR family transcriptional regulator
MEDHDEVQALAVALLEFMAAYRRSRSRLHQDPGLVGLTNAQFAVLEAVQHHGGGGVGSVAGAAGTSQPATTRALERLRSNGLVTRHLSRQDGRMTVYEVSIAGFDLLAHHRRRLHEAASRLHHALPASTRAEAVEILHVLGDVFDGLP